MNPSLRRALVVVDVQNEYVTGNLCIEFPPVERSLANVSRAMDAATVAGVPVVVVQNSSPAGTPVFARGSPGWELHSVVAGRRHDLLVDKSLPSAFAGTNLEGWLRERGIECITLVGYMTHNCIDATVKHAVHAGVTAEVLDDATGSVPYANRAGSASARQIHETVMVVLQSRFANVMSTEQWVATLQGAPAPERGSIVASNRAALDARSAGAA